MKPKWPSNGSFAANVSLVAVGGLLGAGAAWSLKPGGLFGEPFASASAVSEARPSASRNVLAAGAGGPRDRAESTTGRKSPAGDADAGSENFRDAGAAAAANDLAAALEAAGGIASAADQLDFLRGVYSVWSETDPEGALEHAKSAFHPGLIQSELVGLALNKWGHENPREAWLWAGANLDGPLKERGLNDMLVGWTRRYPEDAARWLTDSGLTTPSLFSTLARTWAEDNPGDALKFVNNLPPEAKEAALPAMIPALVSNDPEKALETLKDNFTEPDYVVVFTNSWASLDPVAASSWVDSLPDGMTRREASATLATVWASSDVNGAVAWSSTIGDASLRTRVNTYIGTTWAAIEPEEALTWLSKLPAAESAEGVRGAFHSWAATDPVGLEGYVGETANTAWGDQARRSLADVRSQNDPAGALDLALGLSDSGTRDDSMATYFKKWNQRDGASAGDWLDLNSKRLPDSTGVRLNRIRGKVAPAGVPQSPPAGIPAGI